MGPDDGRMRTARARSRSTITDKPAGRAHTPGGGPAGSRRGHRPSGSATPVPVAAVVAAAPVVPRLAPVTATTAGGALETECVHRCSP